MSAKLTQQIFLMFLQDASSSTLKKTDETLSLTQLIISEK